MATCPKCQTQMADDARFCPECGHQMQDVVSADAAAGLMTIGGMETMDDTVTRGSSSSVPTLEPGEIFAGRYTIEEVVGRGGMGVVYRAQDNLAKKVVALKLIRPERLSGAKAIDRLISEGITARDIRHPNVVAVYDVGTNEGQPFVSMEYLGGPSLRSWHRDKVQKREDVPLAVAAKIVAEIVEGLKAAHDAGVIHRDLKPENIVLMREPTEHAAPLKILDFGIARAAGAALESGTGTGLGTPRYMAPEQITNPDAAGPSADIYSLSVLFYELLVDVLPQGHWQPPSGGRSDVPGGIDQLIEKGLSNRPANRPQSAQEYLELLGGALSGKGTAKKNTDKPNRPPIGGLDGQTLFKWAGGLALAFIALGVIGMMLPEDTGDRDDCAGLSGDAYLVCKGLPIEKLNPVKKDVPEVDDEDIQRSQREALREAEDESWYAAERRNTVSAYQDYLDEWPSGRYVTSARRRIKELTPPPPPPNPYAYLAGEWKLDDGTNYNVSVSKSGSISGTGYAPDGTNLKLRGNLSGQDGTYTITSIYGSANGQLYWDKMCHIAWQGVNAAGFTVAGQIHVRHNPGETVCPS